MNTLMQFDLSPQDQSLLDEMGPAIDDIHARHLTRLRTTPMNPPYELARLAGIAVADDENPDLHEYGPVIRASFKEHIAMMEAQGIDIRPLVMATFLVNTLTEDNLPAYKEENARIARHSEPLYRWLGQWTAEEDSHGEILYLYGLHSGLLSAGFIDLREYQAARSRQLSSRMAVQMENFPRSLAYVSLQEDATDISHDNLGWILDRTGFGMTRKLKGDEGRHCDVYSAFEAAALDIDPDRVVVEIDTQFDDANFFMPGQDGIANFDAFSRQLGLAGILDQRQLHASKHRLATEVWKLQDRTFTTDEAKAAQENLVTRFDPTSPKEVRKNRQMEHLRAKAVERYQAAHPRGWRPLILGHTVRVETIGKKKQLVVA